MPSRAEIRGTIESVLRGVSIVLLAWMLWLSLDRGKPETVVSARSANIGQALRAWSTSGTAPDRIAIQLDSTPTVRDRDWLAALRSAGSALAWSGNLPAAGVDVQPIASPKGGLTVFTAAPSGNRIRLIDDIGSLDTADARGGGARFAIPSASGDIRARVGGTIAATRDADSVQIKRVLVIGNAGWESKFVVAALEEDGWKVDAQMRVAPGVSVTQGSINPIDTSRYSAVIALDESAAAHASDIIRYVANGGGVILSGTASSGDAFSSIRSGAPGRQIAGALLASDPGATTLKAVPLVPIAALRDDAIVLDRRDGQSLRQLAVMLRAAYFSKATSIRGDGAWGAAMRRLRIIVHGGRVQLRESRMLRESQLQLSIGLMQPRLQDSSGLWANHRRGRPQVSPRRQALYHYGGSSLSSHSALSASGHPDG